MIDHPTGEFFDAQAASESLALAAQTLENVSDGVIVLDVDWHIVFANANAAQFVGKTKDELIGHLFWDVFPDAYDHQFGILYREAMRTQTAHQLEAYYGPLQGWFDVRILPAPAGLTLCFMNVNERREAAETQQALIARLEEALSRQSQTQSVVAALADALSLEAVAGTLQQLATATLGAAMARIALVRGDGTTLQFVDTGSSLEPPDAPGGPSFIRTDVPSPLTDAVRLRQPLFHSSRGELLTTYPHQRDMIEQTGARATASLPLVAGGRTIGGVSMWWLLDRELSESDRSFLRVLATQCAQAVERTMLIGRHRTVAETLQQAMLPGELPTVPGCEVAACYRPSAVDLTVGGDWYDAFTLPDGRLVFAVGDVSGHGVEAAAVMGQVRNALRAYVVDGEDPAGALTKLDDLVNRAEHGLYATVIVGVFDPRTGGLLWSNAGHPPLVLRSDDGPRFLSMSPGAPVGVGAAQHHVDHHTVLEVGDTLVAYTDGLIERRNEDLDVGLVRLLATIDAARSKVTEGDWCTELVDGVLGAHVRDDDICVLVLQRT